jgi:hypothetical protein
MNLGIVGSRVFAEPDWSIAAKWAGDYIESQILKFQPEKVVSGGAKGIDMIAERMARKHGFTVSRKRPKPKGPGYLRYVEALFDRNTDIVEESDYLIAIMSKGRSNGTMDTVKKAVKKDIPIILIEVDNDKRMAHFEYNYH